MDRKLAIISSLMAFLLALTLLLAYLKENGTGGFFDPAVPEAPQVTVSPSGGSG